MGCNCGCGGKSQTKKWDLEPKFSDLKKGDKVEIVGYNEGDARYKSKLLSMGLVRGVTLEVLQIAPLGDPIEGVFCRIVCRFADKKRTFLN